ncbi:hypothetical protein GCM10011575_01590 [Microlunatus endophyticus]|uniref:Uncharacterized protein n=1 Tax=Microlunatus endophyticus TaxID=1716077 RepID=A0A917RZK5_9ACTN|nr:hypothetical protein [Microlunatus endophyticus]GGL47440.1 hypothetical protein GCM10011575_01590 [Microlunatus endophyticus]
MARRRHTAAAAVLIVVGLLAVLVVAALVVVHLIPDHKPIPGEQRCVATAAGNAVAVDTEQVQNAAIIAGVAVRRGLAPRAASIAITTAYQESNLRNLDHGDRDSIGLFQQRPSMGWGTAKQLQDPYYATGRFYDALVKIHGWESADITEIAQKIQISGYPDAYRDHEADGRILASVLTGQSPAGLRCLIRDQHQADPAGLGKALHKTYKIHPKRSGVVITISAKSQALAWSYAHFALANARDHGVSSVQVGSRYFAISRMDLASWHTAARPIGSHAVKITLR